MMRFLFLVLFCVSLTLADQLINATSPSIGYVGRVDFSEGDALFDWSATQIVTTICNSSVMSLQMTDVLGVYSVIVNGDRETIVHVNPYPDTSVQFPSADCYPVVVTKITEAENNLNSVARFSGFLVDGSFDTTKYPFTPSQGRRLEFIGDGVTCGYGNLQNDSTTCTSQTYSYEDVTRSYAGILAQEFDAELHVECWSGKGIVHNYGDSAVFSSDPFPNDWNRTFAISPTPIYSFPDGEPDAVYINLGANDFTGPKPYPTQEEFTTGYKNFLNLIRSVYSVKTTFFLACGPMVSGDPCNYIKSIASDEGCEYIDLQDILTDQDYGCDFNPNVSGNQKIADISYPVMSSVLGWN